MKKYKYESYKYDFEKKYYLNLSSYPYAKDLIVRSATYNEDKSRVDLVLDSGGAEYMTISIDINDLIGVNYEQGKLYI